MEFYPSVSEEVPADMLTPKDKWGFITIYIDNGVKLGWLIEPKTKTVEIYRQGKLAEVFNNPKSISGEDILPGFVLDLSDIFS